VADEIKSDSFPVDGLEQVIYWLSAGRDDFDIFAFRAEVPEQVRDADNCAIVIGPSDAESNYHAFFAWSVTDADVDLSVEYRVGKMSASGDTVVGPATADDLMAWLGKFFKDKSITSHLHLRYRYPNESRKSTIPFSFGSPLPASAEIYGIAVRLPDKPSGATSVRLTKESSDWYAEIIADSDVTFADFSPFADAASLQTVLELFLKDGA